MVVDAFTRKFGSTISRRVLRFVDRNLVFVDESSHFLKSDTLSNYVADSMRMFRKTNTAPIVASQSIDAFT